MIVLVWCMGVEYELISLAYTIQHPLVSTAVHTLTKNWLSRLLVVTHQTILYSFLGDAHLGGVH